jgi:TIR domain
VAPRVLFNKHDIYNFVEAERARLKKAYDALPDDKALDESVVKDLKQQFMLHIPTLKPEKWEAEERPGETAVYVPFEGDPAVFEIAPSAFNGTVAIGDIVGSDLVITVSSPFANFDIEACVKREIAKVEWRLYHLRGSMEHMSQQLEIGLRESMMVRRRVIENKEKARQTLTIPRRQPGPVPVPVEAKPISTPKPKTREMTVQKTWDIFMSHASPDKPWVRGLVKALRASDVTVWFDEDTLEWGEDLQRGINRGLKNCRKAIAVLSQSYLAERKWTEAEISGLLAREKLGDTLILPIWHQITEDDLKQYNLIIASRIAKVSESDNYDQIVRAVLKILGRSHDIAHADGSESADTSKSQDSQAKREIVAYAWYETKGPDAKTNKLYVHRLMHMKAWFIFNDGQNERQGTMENISDQFAITDRSLRGQGFVRMTFSNPSGLREFEL